MALCSYFRILGRVGPVQILQTKVIAAFGEDDAGEADGDAYVH